jgi:hypothetical protein
MFLGFARPPSTVHHQRFHSIIVAAVDSIGHCTCCEKLEVRKIEDNDFDWRSQGSLAKLGIWPVMYRVGSYGHMP